LGAPARLPGQGPGGKPARACPLRAGKPARACPARGQVFDTVAIFGLGQIGGSLAWALRKRSLARRLIGFEPKAVLRAEACNRFLDEAYPEAPKSLSHVHLVILAAPVRVNIQLVRNLAPLLEGQLVTDVGSTKTAILEAVTRLKGPFLFIGGHPMAGTERQGVESWNPDLFEGHPYFLCSGPGVTPDILARMQEWVSALGAKPIVVDPERHDRLLAYTSHLPYLLATTLVKLVGNLTENPLSPYLGSGFQSTARVAGCSPEMMADVLGTNREAVIEAVEQYQSLLTDLVEQLHNTPPDRTDLENLCQTLGKIQKIWEDLHP